MTGTNCRHCNDSAQSRVLFHTETVKNPFFVVVSLHPRLILCLVDIVVDGKEVGSIQSKLLGRSILDLYMGDDPFDRKAKEEIERNLASLFQQ